jgi:hypothetical protein
VRLKTTVGQVALVGGSRYDQGRGILVDERASRFARGRNRGNLYVYVEVTGPAAGRDIIADQLAGIVADIYYDWRGSVTAGLQQALQEANRLLFEENRNSLPGEQRTAGVCCAVLRDLDLFVAQVGPAAIYVDQDGEVDRFPDRLPWLEGVPPEEMDAAALGERHDLNVVLFHYELGQGDTFLLAGSTLIRHVPGQAWPDILAGASVAEVVDALIVAGERRDLSALVVRLDGQGSEPEPAPAAPAAGVVPPAVARGPSAWEQLTASAAGLQVGERLQRASQAVLAGLAGIWAGFLALLGRMIPSRSEPRPVAGRQTSTVTSSATKSKKRQKPRAEEAAPSDLVQKILIGVAIAIPLVVAAVVLVTVIQRGQTNRAELDALWQQADTLWQAAQATADPTVARTQLTESMGYLDQLLERRPDHAEAAELQKRIVARLDEINQVKRISWIGELTSYPADAELSRVVVEGAHIFVMDRRNGRVYHHQLDELQQALLPESRETVLVRRGDQVGDVLVGDLVDMVWMPAGSNRQKSDLLILESGGGLLEYDPTTQELRALALAATETWQYAELVGSYYGRFYVLDSIANKIWRYSPTEDGYSDPPDDWLQESVDMTGVRDMAIGDSIYLLYADGKIRKLTAGLPDTFDISGWDMPPQDPSSPRRHQVDLCSGPGQQPHRTGRQGGTVRPAVPAGRIAGRGERRRARPGEEPLCGRDQRACLHSQRPEALSADPARIARRPG